MINILSEKFVDKKSKKFPDGYWVWECDVTEEFVALAKKALNLKKKPTNLQLEKFIIDSLTAAFSDFDEKESKCCGKCKCGKK